MRYLVQLVNIEGKKIGKEIFVKHKMTNQDMANFIGCTRQSVSKVLNELKKENIIYSGERSSFWVKDFNLLEDKISVS